MRPWSSSSFVIVALAPACLPPEFEFAPADASGFEPDASIELRESGSDRTSTPEPVDGSSTADSVGAVPETGQVVPDASFDSPGIAQPDALMDVRAEPDRTMPVADAGHDASGSDDGCARNCAGKTCGASDGCGGSCSQGTCAPPTTCGGGGTPNVCGCTPACPNNVCQTADGCGGTCTCPIGLLCVAGKCLVN